MFLQVCLFSNKRFHFFDVTILVVWFLTLISAGNSMDWAYRMNITFSYLIELSNNSFITPTREIVSTGKEALVILLTVIDHLHMGQEEMASIPPPNDLFEEVVVET